jgi:hypothetical protein
MILKLFKDLLIPTSLKLKLEWLTKGLLCDHNYVHLVDSCVCA